MGEEECPYYGMCSVTINVPEDHKESSLYKNLCGHSKKEYNNCNQHTIESKKDLEKKTKEPI